MRRPSTGKLIFMAITAFCLWAGVICLICGLVARQATEQTVVFGCMSLCIGSISGLLAGLSDNF